MLFVVVLTMVVALTVGLSVVSRSVTNLRISRQNEESQRAFQAAEAGIEQILQSSPGCIPGATCSSLSFQNNSSYTTSVSYPRGTSFLLNGEDLVDQDSGIDVWLSEHPDFNNQVSGSITIYWSTDNQTSCTNTGGVSGPASVKSAIEVIILTGNRLNPGLNKYVIEANGCTRIASALAASGGGIPPGTTVNFNSSATIGLVSGLVMKIIPIFNSTKIAITSTAELPDQGTIVTSTGKSGQTVRKIQYFSSFPQVPPEAFPYVLISQ